MSTVAPHDVRFDQAPCGLLATDGQDRIIEVNETFLAWSGYTAAELIGRDFHTLLDIGSQAFYGTRYQSELWERSEVREVAVTLQKSDGSPMPVLLNARLTRASDGAVDDSVVRVAVFDASNRQDYEREMLAARRVAEAAAESMRTLQQAP